MTNLLRRCENCVNSAGVTEHNSIHCFPKLPFWVHDLVYEHPHWEPATKVHNNSAEQCDAFRLRDIGENHNV